MRIRRLPGRTLRTLGTLGTLGTLMCRASSGVSMRALPLLTLARPDLGNPLRMRDFKRHMRPGGIVEAWDGHARQPLADRLFDVAEAPLLFRRDERERRAGRFRP